MSNNPKKIVYSSNIDQGTMIDCILCSVIYPNDDRPHCPECHGKKHYFVPAQMMDKSLSQKFIISELNTFFKTYTIHSLFDSQQQVNKQTDLLKESCLNLLRKISIYNFELKDFLVDLIRNSSRIDVT